VLHCLLDKKIIKNPCEVLLSACAFMRYWAGIYPEEAQWADQQWRESDDADNVEATREERCWHPRLALQSANSKDEDDSEADIGAIVEGVLAWIMCLCMLLSVC
jgi:hypothetical protein